jgi:iron complex outermembrane receptor protein
MAGIQEKKFGANGFYASPAFKDQYEEVQVSLVSAIFEKSFRKISILMQKPIGEELRICICF